MRPKLAKHTRSLLGERGAHIVAAGAPLTTIVAHVLASYEGDAATSNTAVRSLCSLLNTSKGFRHAVLGWQGAVPVDFTPTTAQAAAGFAAWLARHGRLVNTLELHFRRRTIRADTESAVAAALQAAAAAPGSTAGLQIRSCKLDDAGSHSTAILQALPAGTLTSLEIDISIPTDTPADDKQAMLERMGQAFATLQQLRQLKLSYDDDCCDYIGVGDALQDLSALTNLTRLNIPEVAYGEELQQLPPSLLELQFYISPDAPIGDWNLDHLTALTKLDMGHTDMINAHHVLPPNLLQLSVGTAASVACLLPLGRLQQLTLQYIEEEALPAAQLRQLSVLTSLTSVDFTYGAGAHHIDAAASGWSALPMQDLHLHCPVGASLQRSTLMQLSSLTGLSSVFIDANLTNIRPEMLGDVLAQLTNLQTLSIESLSWTYQQQQQPEDTAAGDAEAEGYLACMLGRLAGGLHRMQLYHLSLSGRSIGRADAAALACMEGLCELELASCDLEDCSVAVIAFALHQTLEELNLANNPRVTDASLPVLARLVPGITEHQLRGTGVTAEGLQQYLPPSSEDATTSRTRAVSQQILPALS